MGKLYLIMGKSATGKDHIYKAALEKLAGVVKPVVPYTTRPMRENETNGVEYNFVTFDEMQALKAAGKVIESRVYHVVVGDWYYFTCDDGQIDLSNGSNLLIVTPEAYKNIRDYYGAENVFPIYIESADAERLARSMKREGKQEKPNYAEVCRRYLADEADFSEEILLELGIDKRFENVVLEDCVDEVVNAVLSNEAKEV